MKSVLMYTMLLSSLLATACASSPQDANAAPANSGEVYYRTGSNIPVRDKTPLTPEEKEKRAEESRRMMQEMQTPGIGSTKQ